MTTVPRHPVDRDVAQRQLDALAPQITFYLDYIEKDTAALRNVQARALELVRYRSILDPTAAEDRTWTDLRTAAQAATAIFAAAAADEGQIQAVVAQLSRFTATGPVSYANAGAWLHAVWPAVILRDDDLIARLCSIPEEILRASGATHDAYIYPWVQTVRNYLTNQEITPDLFNAVLDGTDPDQARITPPRIGLQLVYPPIEMFYQLLRRDSEQFDKSLVRALEQHREHWTSDEDLVDDPDGFIAFAPLAIAVLARSAGMSVDVESEYLPSSFLRGNHP